MSGNELRTQAPDLKGFLNKHQDAIASVAAKNITPERMVRLVCAAATRQPDLAECTPVSILRSMISAAEFGLEVCSGANEAYLVPYNVKVKRDGRECWEKQAQFIPGYQGLVKKAIESGKVRNIEARVVYEKDQFDFEYGLEPTVKHKPHLGSDRGQIVAVYAVAFLADGSKQFEVMAKDEVDAIKDRGKEKKFSPWTSDYSEMARKTVVRRLYKYIPKSKVMADLLELQAKVEAGEFEPDPDPSRPGDANPPEAETIEGWTDEDLATAKACCAEMTEALMDCGMDQKEAEELMTGRWQTIGLPDLSPNTWHNRFLTFWDRHLDKKVANG